MTNNQFVLLIRVLVWGFNGVIRMLAYCHPGRHQIHEYASENCIPDEAIDTARNLS